MDLGPEKVVEMNRMSREQKWSRSRLCSGSLKAKNGRWRIIVTVIFVALPPSLPPSLSQHEMREGASSVYYVEQLVRHILSQH